MSSVDNYSSRNETAAQISKSFDNNGYTIRKHALKTKALDDTLSIIDEEKRVETMQKMNQLGRFMIEELDMPKWMRKDDLVCYTSTISAISRPTVQERHGSELEFEKELISRPLMSLKIAKRHKKAKDILEKDPMMIVPRNQV